MRQQRRTERGFSLIELLVALAIAGLIVVAAMESFRMQNETYTIVDQTTEAQQNMRAVGDLMERDIRATAIGVPEEVGVCGVDAINAPDTLFVTDAATIQPFLPGPTGALAENRPMYASIPGNPGTVGVSVALPVDKLILEENIAPPPGAYALGDFQVGGGVIVANIDQPSQGTACGIITAITPGVTGGTLTVDFLTGGLGVPHSLGEQLVAVPAHVYQIVINNGISELRRNGNLLASDVEDLQIAWFIDVDGDGQRANVEMFGSAAPGAQLYFANGPLAADHRLMRELRINLVVTSRDQDPGGNGGAFLQTGMQAMENRVFVAAPNDGFRRRVHTTTVRLRNVGFRGRMGKKVGI